MAEFKEKLKDALRQMAFRTSLDKLKKKGVQQVNVLGIDRIAGLVEAAVHRALRSQLVGSERDAVADETKAEFLRLLRSNEDLQRQKSEIERQVERAEEEIDLMRRELGEKQRALQVKLEQDEVDLANRYQGENKAIAHKVAEVVRALAGDPQLSLNSLEGRVMELVMDVVSSERQTAESARRALQDREVDTLQRRIKKLNETLAATEHRLQQTAAMKDIPSGISSVYREVQGLDVGDRQVDKKRELMADIFRANLKLQKGSMGA